MLRLTIFNSSFESQLSLLNWVKSFFTDFYFAIKKMSKLILKKKPKNSISSKFSTDFYFFQFFRFIDAFQLMIDQIILTYAKNLAKV